LTLLIGQNTNAGGGVVTAARARAKIDVKLVRKDMICYCQRDSPLSPLFIYIGDT
jgi:hypothetical protein